MEKKTIEETGHIVTSMICFAKANFIKINYPRIPTYRWLCCGIINFGFSGPGALELPKISARLCFRKSVIDAMQSFFGEVGQSLGIATVKSNVGICCVHIS